MNLLRSVISLFLLALLPLLSARAESGDIVCSARYYNPPGSKAGTTCWHLYRLNPDGTGRQQITTGPFDDVGPHWSPDGKQIAFLRKKASTAEDRNERSPLLSDASLCVVSASGGAVRVVRTFPGADTFAELIGWSPDGKTIAVHLSRNSAESVALVDRVTGAYRTIGSARGIAWSPSGNSALIDTASPDEPDRVWNVRSDRQTTLPKTLLAFGWHNDSTLSGVTQSGSPRSIVLLTPEGKEIKRVPLAQVLKDNFDGDAPRETRSLPGDTDHLLYGMSSGESTGGHFLLYHRVSLTDGSATPFTAGQFLSWSPDNRRFCTIVNRSLEDYGKRPDGTAASVWVQHVLVGDARTGKTKEITHGFVYALGADWRPAEKL